MQAFKNFSGIVAPLARSNIDTDAIFPKQFMKSIKRTGFGVNLFSDWRYLNTSKSLNNILKLEHNHDFILNKKPYDKAEILLTKENFGCGSSREHAVWALRDFGFKVIIAQSYGDIFYSNSFKNGLLPIILKPKEIDDLLKTVYLETGFKLTVNLEEQRVGKYFFKIDTGFKERLLEGLDDIELTLKLVKKIRNYEKNKKKSSPWLFKDINV